MKVKEDKTQLTDSLDTYRNELNCILPYAGEMGTPTTRYGRDMVMVTRAKDKGRGGLPRVG